MLIRSSALIVLQKEDRTPLRDITAESIREKAILHLIVVISHSRTIRSWMLCCDQWCETLVHDRCWWTPPYWGEQDIWCEWSVLHFDNSLIVNPSLISHGVGKQLSCHISDRVMLNWGEGSNWTAESIGCGELGFRRAVTGSLVGCYP